MSQSYKAPNGLIVIAQDEVQAAAFINAGFEEAEAAKPRKTTKSE